MPNTHTAVGLLGLCYSRWQGNETSNGCQVAEATNQVGLNTRRSLNHEEFRGFVLIDEYAPWVFVNSNDTKSAQMFTLAHEMVHLWIGKPGLFKLEKVDVAEDDIERYCNQVAAEFLISNENFSAYWERTGSVRI